MDTSMASNRMPVNETVIVAARTQDVLALPVAARRSNSNSSTNGQGPGPTSVPPSPGTVPVPPFQAFQYLGTSANVNSGVTVAGPMTINEPNLVRTQVTPVSSKKPNSTNGQAVMKQMGVAEPSGYNTPAPYSANKPAMPPDQQFCVPTHQPAYNGQQIGIHQNQGYPPTNQYPAGNYNLPNAPGGAVYGQYPAPQPGLHPSNQYPAGSYSMPQPPAPDGDFYGQCPAPQPGLPTTSPNQSPYPMYQQQGRAPSIGFENMLG